MNTLTTFAQSFYNTDFYPSASNGVNADATANAALVILFFTFYFIFLIVLYVIISLLMMQIFKKAGVKPWIAWVPVYNSWKLYEIGGQQGFWAVLLLVPIVNIVSSIYLYIAMYHIGKKLEKPGEFVLLGIFLPLVWFIWLAVDKSKWNDGASTAPSLA